MARRRARWKLVLPTAALSAFPFTVYTSTAQAFFPPVSPPPTVGVVQPPPTTPPVVVVPPVLPPPFVPPPPTVIVPPTIPPPVVVPPTLALCGYFPGKALRKVGDLPEGVMRQWRRWCLDPEYAVGAEGPTVRAAYAAVRAPVVSISFADDEMMSSRNTESIHGFYSGAPRTMKRIAPRDIGVKRIGHFGFFRAAFESSLWRGHVLPELR